MTPETRPVIRKTRSLIGSAEIVVWLVLAAAAVGVLMWAFPRALPFGPEDWRTRRGEAIEIALERLRDLGEPVEDPYVSATLLSPAALEMRLRRSGQELGWSQEELARTRIGRRINYWQVLVHRRDSSPNEWSYLIQVGLDGEVLTLLRGVPPGFRSEAALGFADAVGRANEFLVAQGFDLASFDEPTERRVDVSDFRYLFLRYRDLEAAVGGELDYGVEVRFVGEQLHGFLSWWNDPAPEAFAQPLRLAALLNTGHIFVIFLFVPIVSIVFVRRYHEGVVGVRNAAIIFVAVAACMLLHLMLTARGAATGSAMGNVSRMQMTWIWSAVQALIYIPGWRSFRSAAGESVSRFATAAGMSAWPPSMRCCVGDGPTPPLPRPRIVASPPALCLLLC